MKKLNLLLLVVILLTACQPHATPQLTEPPVPASIDVLPTESPAPASTVVPTTEPTTESTKALVIEQLVGVYKTHIGAGGAAYGIEDGQYLLKLREDLRWFVVSPGDGFTFVQGYYTYTSDQIVIKGTGGPSIGSCSNVENTYGWTAEGANLTFTPINVDDKCEEQKFFFTENSFTLQP